MKSRLWRALTMVLVLALLLPLTAGAEPYAPQSTEPAVIPAGGVGARMDPMTQLDAELRTLAKEGGAVVAEGDLTEAVELPGRRFVLGVQWHPEVDPDSRVVAAFVDSMLQVIVLGAALLLMGTSFADVSAVAGAGATQFGTLELGQLAVAVLISLMFALVNRVILVAVHGWTLGKLFVGLRCVNALGRPPGLVPAITRGLVMYLIEGILGFLGSMLLLLSILGLLNAAFSKHAKDTILAVEHPAPAAE